MLFPDLLENLEYQISHADNLIQGVSPINLIDTSFAVIAVRCNSARSTGCRKLIPGQVYYFLEGYDVLNNPGERANFRKNLDLIYDDYIFEDSFTPHVQISAVVGKNGSGKSSLIEFMMRLINNLATSIFGDFRKEYQDRRLHFIMGVDGDLWFTSQLGDGRKPFLYQLHIDNSNVFIKSFEKHDSDKGEWNVIFQRDMRGYKDKPIPRYGKNIKNVLNNFFYSIFSNYSIYAYNPNDMKDERDEVDALLYKNDPTLDRISPFKSCWINSLFHRNDSYQIPIVLTPERNDGNIDVNVENELAKERLISLLIKNEKYRTINNHLDVDYLELYVDFNKYKYDSLSRLGLTNVSASSYEKIKSDIISLWGEKLGEDLSAYKDKPYYDIAIGYLVFKTLKIGLKYEQHNQPFKKLEVSDENYDKESIKSLVESESNDLSHVTRKVFRVLAYLIYDVYSFQGIESKIESVIPSDIEKKYKKNAWPKYIDKIKKYKENRVYTAVVLEALLPPPFLICDIFLKEKSGKQNEKIPFSTISSGERQLAYTVTSILYHLDNLNSADDDLSFPDRIKYRNVLLVLDEVELYFHPAYQQQFCKYLLDGIRQMTIDKIKGIHIIMVTHSPYVLSDIPKENVLALEDNGMPSEKKIKTFCGNIHEMLKDSFFLPNGTAGEFAQWETGHLMAVIELHKKYYSYVMNIRGKDITSYQRTKIEKYWQRIISDVYCSENSVYEFAKRYISHKKDSRYILHYEVFLKDFSEEMLRERIRAIDEPIIRSILETELSRVFVKTDDQLRKARIRELESELKRLRQEETNV